jgi:hypothetical protein
MASEQFQGREKVRFPALMGFGIALGIAVIAVAMIVDTAYGIPLVILIAVCVAAAFTYRLVAGRHRDTVTDHEDSVPKLSVGDERPVGDTPEAHDELNPHDLPVSHPGRHDSEEMADGADGTTRGPVQ